MVCLSLLQLPAGTVRSWAPGQLLDILPPRNSKLKLNSHHQLPNLSRITDAGLQGIQQSKECCPSTELVVRERKRRWATIGRLLGRLLRRGGTGRLYPRVTINVVPDNVLLEIFEFYLGKDQADLPGFGHKYDRWQTLVHVCRRWRSIVFTSPRRLDLKLYCTPQRSVNSKTLEIWPELPIVVVAENMESKDDVTNIIATLRQHNRVCKMYYFNVRFQDSFLNQFAAINEPFPALTSLELYSGEQQDVPVLPDSFLGGSAPCLQSLCLGGIAYPSIGTLLSSTTNLVRLSLWGIPHSGYISPETIIPCLAMSPRLKSFGLGFQYSRSQDNRESRHPPPLTRVVFPNLTSFSFHGDIEYLEDILPQIDTPVLGQSNFYFFNQLVFNTPLLGQFIRRTETLINIHEAHIQFRSSDIWITLSVREGMADGHMAALQFVICCKSLGRQLSAIAQVLNSFLSSLPTLESLNITVSRESSQCEIEVIQWREFLHLFTAVKKVTLKSEHSVQIVAPALQELAVEGATEVLPALQNLFLRTGDWQLSGPVKEAIEQFIAARQLCGHPVSVHHYGVRHSPSTPLWGVEF